MKAIYVAPRVALYSTEHILAETLPVDNEGGRSGEYLSNSAAIDDEDDDEWLDRIDEQALVSILERDSVE